MWEQLKPSDGIGQTFSETVRTLARVAYPICMSTRRLGLSGANVDLRRSRIQPMDALME